MIKKSIFLVGLTVSVMFCSCGNSNLKVYDDGVLEMNSLMGCNIEASFESMGYEPVFVALETSENSLLPNNSHVAYATDSDAFIIGQNRIYRFAIDGSFKNMVGSIGQGPMEYSRIHCLSFNEKNSLIYIYDGSRRMLLWTMDNRPMKQVDLVTDGYISMAYALQDGYWAEERSSIDGKVSYGIVWFDANGLQIAKKELFSFPDNEAASYFTAPIVKQISDNCYFYYDAFSCAGYEITGPNVKKVVTINYGDFGAEKEKLNDMAYREQNRDKFIEILDFNYDDNKIILLTVKGNTFKASIVDMSSGYCLFCHNINNPRRGGGIEIWNDSKPYILPSYFKNGTMYGLTDTSEIDPEILKNMGVAIDPDTEANPSLVMISPQ